MSVQPFNISTLKVPKTFILCVKGRVVSMPGSARSAFSFGTVRF